MLICLSNLLADELIHRQVVEYSRLCDSNQPCWHFVRELSTASYHALATQLPVAHTIDFGVYDTEASLPHSSCTFMGTFIHYGSISFRARVRMGQLVILFVADPCLHQLPVLGNVFRVLLKLQIAPLQIQKCVTLTRLPLIVRHRLQQDG